MAVKKVQGTVTTKKPALKKTKKDVIENIVTPQQSAPVTASKPANKAKKETNLYPNAYIHIDHPQDGETLLAPHYAVRLGASTEGIVEIQINSGEWVPCRYNSGYWWYDIYDFKPGAVKLSARIVDQSGKVIKKTAVIKCKMV